MEEQEKKQDSREERTDNSPYHKQPRLTKRTTSKLQQHLNRGMTAFLVVAASIVFYFAFFRRSWKNLSDFETNHLWVCFGIFVEPTYEDGRKFYCEAVKGKDKKRGEIEKVCERCGDFYRTAFCRGIDYCVMQYDFAGVISKYSKYGLHCAGTAQ